MPEDKKNPAGELVYRMLCSVFGSFAREFGAKNVKAMVRFISEHEEYWSFLEQLESEENASGGLQPWRRGAHDFLRKPNVG